MTISDFSNFLGLTYGDTIDKAIAIFGEQHDSYNNPENHYQVYYYRFRSEDTLSISFSRESRKIESVFLGQRRASAVWDMIDTLKIDDLKAGFIDKHIDEIIDHFGVPDEENPDSYIYRDSRMEVEFLCPENNDFFCQSINIVWFY